MRNLVSVGKICFLCIWSTEKMIKIAIQTKSVNNMVGLKCFAK